MGVTIFSGILVILTIAWVVVAPFNLDGFRIGRGWALIPLLVAGLMLGVASTTVIQAKNVGVLTTFGKTSNRTLGPGLHLKAPWQRVIELDGTIKTDKYGNGSGTCNNETAGISVRIGDGSQSCVSITHRWQVIPEQANTIYGNFRSNDPTESLRDAVVSTQLYAVTQDVLAKYNPVADLQVVEGAKAQAISLNFAPDYDKLSSDIQAGMEARYGSDPLVRTIAITVSYVSLSESTQAKINSFIAEVANTRIAAQRAQTAANEAAANRALAASVSRDPNVLVSKCFDTVAEAQKSGYQLPAGFSCWPGSDSAVVVPSAR